MALVYQAIVASLVSVDIVVFLVFQDTVDLVVFQVIQVSLE